MTANLTLIGPGADLLSISGDLRYQLLSFASGTTNSVQRLSFIDALATGYRHGGAISNAGALSLESRWFQRNTNQFGWGGAVYNQGVLLVANCRFESNHAEGKPGDAGSVFSSIERYYFIGPGGGGPGLGGGLFHDSGWVHLSNVTTGANGGNSSQLPFDYGGGQGGLGAGAGLLVDQGRLRIAQSRFQENLCRGGDGGSDRYGANGGSPTAVAARRCRRPRPARPRASPATRFRGGGKSNPGPRGSGNAYGAGIAIEACEARIENSTISGNRPEKPLERQTEGAGIAVGSQSGADACQVTLRFLTIAANFAAGNPDYADTGIVSPPIRVPGGEGGGLNPRLGPLRDNGGGTLSHLPMANSPLIDAAQILDLPLTDQRGLRRLGGPSADLGAVEAESPVPPSDRPSLTLIQRATDPPEITFLVLGAAGSHLNIETSSNMEDWESVAVRFSGQAFRAPIKPEPTFFRIRQIIMPP